LVKRWLEQYDGQFIFDGFPRTVGQAEALDQILQGRGTSLDLVIALEAKLSTLQDRVKNRLICTKCGQIVSLGLHVPTADTPCPMCGGKLSKRSDDTSETLQRRMVEYEQKTQPLIAFYKERGLLHRVDTTPKPERVFDSIAKIVED
jgi:adenylate kinase